MSALILQPLRRVDRERAAVGAVPNLEVRDVAGEIGIGDADRTDRLPLGHGLLRLTSARESDP